MWTFLPARPTIHFITHIFPTNAADLTFNAGVYFPDLFFNYPCVWHRILDVEFELIKPTDWVIFSGGDIYHPSHTGLFNKIIFLTGGRVISWGCGYNLQDIGDRFLDESLNKQGFVLFTTRDYNLTSAFGSPERYVPCVSCMQPGLEVSKKITHDAVVIEHKWFPINDFPQYEKTNNTIQALQLIDFIASSNVVITNSYHMVYWATLLGKKVILVGKYASKFDYYKYKPVLYSGNLQMDIDNAAIYPNSLKECRDLNIAFAQEVINLIETDDHKKRDLTEIYSKYINSADEYLPLNEISRQISHVHKRIDQTYAHADTAHKRLSDETSHIHRRIDETYSRADEAHIRLSDTYSSVDKALRNVDDALKQITELQKQREIRFDEALHHTEQRIDELCKHNLFSRVKKFFQGLFHKN